MRLFYPAILLLFVFQNSFSQSLKNSSTNQSMDEVVSSFLQSDYEVATNFQVTLQSDKSYKTILKLQSNFSYVIVLCTQSGIQAGAIELRDDNGIVVAYEQKVNEPNNNQVTLEYDAGYDGSYTASFKMIDDKRSNCSANICVLQKEDDSTNNGN